MPRAIESVLWYSAERRLELRRSWQLASGRNPKTVGIAPVAGGYALKVNLPTPDPEVPEGSTANGIPSLWMFSIPVALCRFSLGEGKDLASVIADVRN